MAQNFYGILTAVGEAKDANAKALGIPLVFTEMAVGDGNGIVPVPDKNRKTLVREVRRAPLNSLTRDKLNANQVIAEQIIPESVGGWFIRELGLYDADGDLVAIANCPETYKPLLAEGSGRVQAVRLVVIISSADNVQLKIDPSIILATREYADSKAREVVVAHEAAANPHSQYATKTALLAHLEAEDPHSQYATKTAVKETALLSAPPGSILFFAHPAPPTGWIKCNGAAVSRSAYSVLFAAIGTYYGAGDGVSTFNLPDLRGEFLRGYDEGRGVDSGRVFGSAQASTRFPSMFTYSLNSTTGSLVTHPISVNTVYPNDNKATNMDSEITSATGPYMTVPLSPSGGTNAVSFTARPRNVALLPIIKY